MTKHDARLTQWTVIVIAVAVLLLGMRFDGQQRFHDKPTTQVAPEVCATQGYVTRVQEHDHLYYVTCHSGTVVLVRP